MRKKAILFSGGIVTVIAVTLGLLAGNVQARTQPAADGQAAGWVWANFAFDFSAGNAGLFNTTAATQGWFQHMSFDLTNPKTYTIRGKRTILNGSISCQGAVVDINGAVLLGDVVAITNADANNTYVQKTGDFAPAGFPNPAISSTAGGTLFCNLTGNNSVRYSMVTYTQ